MCFEIQGSGSIERSQVVGLSWAKCLPELLMKADSTELDN